MENKENLELRDYNDVTNIIIYNLLKKNFEKYSQEKFNTIILEKKQIDKYINKFNEDNFISKLKKKTIKIMDKNYIYNNDYFNEIWDKALLDKEKCKNQLRLELYKYQNEIREEMNISLIDI